ncbi:MAG: hypothetical protein LBR53_11640, partial [Deltaproteobacteria bacterium]|nr:hypothetical protein [Deltaproteobacteria bacterium]
MGRLKEIRRKRALKLVFMALAFPLFLSCGAVPPEDPFYLAEAKSSLARGHHWYQVGCYREAERFFSESLTNARLSDSVLHIVMSLNAKGASRLAAGDKSGAAAVLNEALELTTSEPGRPELPALLGNLGTLAYQAGRPEDARDFWSEASREAETRGESPAPYLASLARLSFERGDGEAFKAALSSALSGLEDPSCPKSARADVLNLAAL